MKRHAAFPDIEQLQRVDHELIPSIDQHIAHSTTQHHAQRGAPVPLRRRPVERAAHRVVQQREEVVQAAAQLALPGLAVGAGGFSGRGVEGASQTRLDYLPEHATDFVFASLAEQRGFVGSSILLLLYLFVVWRGLRVVTVAGDLFGAVAAGGIVVAFLFQVFVNVGMTMGIAPVTGIPLPFVTVGGSSMVANMLAIGVLLSVHARGSAGRLR